MSLTNRKKADLFFAVLEGKTIQFRTRTDWYDLDSMWHGRIRATDTDAGGAIFLNNTEYRVKPEPGVAWRYDYQYERNGKVVVAFYSEEYLAEHIKDGLEPDTGPYFKGRVKYVEVIE